MSLAVTCLQLEDAFANQLKPLHTRAYRALGNQEQAEEAAQEAAFLQLMKVIIGKQVDCLQAYCVQVVRNLALRRQQAEGRFRAYTKDGEFPQVATGVSPEQIVQERQALTAFDHTELLEMTLQTLAADYAVCDSANFARSVPLHVLARLNQLLLDSRRSFARISRPSRRRCENPT